MSLFVTSAAQSQNRKNLVDRKIIENQMLECARWNYLYSLSRGAPSTTRPPLRRAPDTAIGLDDQALFRGIGRLHINIRLQEDASETGTTREHVGTFGTFTAHRIADSFRRLWRLIRESILVAL